MDFSASPLSAAVIATRLGLTGLATSAITGTLTLTKTGTTARTVTFPDAAITVARTDAAQTFTGKSTFTDGILTTHADAATSAGVHIGNATHQDVAIFGAGGSQGTTLYGQMNGTAVDLTGAAGLTTRQAATQDAVKLLGRAGGTGSYVGTVTTATLSASRTYTLPDAAITVAGSASELTSGRVPYVTTGGLLTDSASLTFSSGTLTVASGLTVAAALPVTLSSNAVNFERAAAASYISQKGLSGTITVRGSISTEFDTLICDFAPGQVTSYRQLIVPNGTAAAPGLRITSEASGIYRRNSTSLGAAVAGVASLGVIAPAAGFGGALILETPVVGDVSYIIPGSNTASIILSGASSTTVGGQVRAYGSTHATKADYVEFTRGATVSAFFDGSGILTANNTTDATTTSDGSVRLAGGLSVAANKAIVAGGNVIFATATAASTTAGTLQRETNQDKHYAFTNGIGGWVDKCIFSQYASVTQSGVVTAQSLASATARGTRTLPANFFKAGKVLKFRLCGVYTTDAVPGNATIAIKIGSTTIRTTASFAPDASITDGYWLLDGEFVCQTAGGTGTIAGQTAWMHGQVSPPSESPMYAEPMTTFGAVTIDTTAAGAFDVVWTATDAGTAITCTCFRLWEIC